MNLNTDHSLELLALVERFEEAWELDDAPSMEKFIETVAVDRSGSASFRLQLLVELVPVDIEHRWRRYWNSTGTASPDERIPRDRSPHLRMLEDYLERFPPLAANREVLLDLMIDEFRARHYWGDCPSIDEYHLRFDHFRRELNCALPKVLAECAPLVLTVYFQKKAVYAGFLVGLLEVGRQCRGEPGPFTEMHTDAKSRLVVAAKPDNRVSRQHLLLERAARDLVNVTNCSTKRDTLLGLTRLPPSQSAQVNLPILLDLGHCAIRLELLEDSTL